MSFFLYDIMGVQSYVWDSLWASAILLCTSILLICVYILFVSRYKERRDSMSSKTRMSTLMPVPITKPQNSMENKNEVVFDNTGIEIRIVEQCSM